MELVDLRPKMLARLGETPFWVREDGLVYRAEDASRPTIVRPLVLPSTERGLPMLLSDLSLAQAMLTAFGSPQPSPRHWAGWRDPAGLPELANCCWTSSDSGPWEGPWEQRVPWYRYDAALISLWGEQELTVVQAATDARIPPSRLADCWLALVREPKLLVRDEALEEWAGRPSYEKPSYRRPVSRSRKEPYSRRAESPEYVH